MAKLIAKVLVGSRLHNLHTEESDYDFRYVYADETSEVLSLLYNNRNNKNFGDSKDDASWEVGNFMRMATKCNPTALEVILGNVESTTAEFEMIRNSFSSFLSKEYVYNAYKYYSKNQEDRYLMINENRKNKFLVASIRTLIHGCELLSTGHYHPQMLGRDRDILIKIKESNVVITEDDLRDLMAPYKAIFEQCYKISELPKEFDYDRINSILYYIRTMNF